MNDYSLYEKSRHTNSGITFIGIKASNSFPLHWHEHLEFHFMVSGRAKIQCGGQIIDFRTNDCLIINSNELHKSIDAENCECFRFKLHPSFFDNKCHVFTNLVRDDKIINYMQKIMELYKKSDDASEYIIKGHIFYLIGYLCENYRIKTLSSHTLKQNDEKFNKMNTVASYLHSGYASEIKVEKLADMCHYTYSYFSSAFKEVFGMPLTKYLLSLRINKAKTLLLTTDMNITEIGISCGFSDANYFARAFKKETKKSPTDFREKLNN